MRVALNRQLLGLTQRVLQRLPPIATNRSADVPGRPDATAMAVGGGGHNREGK